MCLVLFAWHTRPDLPLVIAANRDEFYARPTEPLQRWDDGFVAGRDLLAGGTWMGITEGLRFAAVTNVRDSAPTAGTRSRGALPVEYLRAPTSPADYAAQVTTADADYGSFNLLVGDPDELWWVTNRPNGRRQRVAPGLHGLSNAELDTPWPKVTGGTRSLAAALADDDGSADSDPEAYFDVLTDADPAPWEALPDTGVGPELERALSSRFIRHSDYGTRACTLLRVRSDGTYDITERRFDENRMIGEIRFPRRSVR
ncbi:NRDE family protein [Rhodococcus marinonascens]|uniref:NRDE family protein n=1 Tax=Rhodococcus marinonascens TaxID=38311 RepID=UPI000932CD0A|nr:NRDE family protein [Rhodococcus marinonascens]